MGIQTDVVCCFLSMLIGTVNTSSIILFILSTRKIASKSENLRWDLIVLPKMFFIGGNVEGCLGLRAAKLCYSEILLQPIPE